MQNHKATKWSCQPKGEEELASPLRSHDTEMETGVRENARIAEREGEQIKRANTALTEANSQLKLSNEQCQKNAGFW